MDGARKLMQQREYWNKRYEDPQWQGKAIRFGMFENSSMSLGHAVDNNDAVTLNDILEHTSLFRSITEFNAIDFGCGKGSLLIELSKRLPKCNAMGIDISEIAIKEASAAARGNPKFIQGSLEELKRCEAGTIDLLVVREVLGFLSVVEQGEFWSTAKKLLRPGGIVYWADAVAAGKVDEEFTSLFAKPILLENIAQRNVDTGETDIDACARSSEFDVIYSSRGVHDIYLTYLKASEIATPESRLRYAALADRLKSKEPYLQYERRIFIKRNASEAGSEKGAVACKLRAPFRKLRESETYAIAGNSWTLLIGRSGAGKTTLLHVFAGLHPKETETIQGLAGNRRFLLSQDAKLFDDLTVEQNVALFCPEPAELERIMRALGLIPYRHRKVRKGLSGGERQRTLIAQALASFADIILLDEPLKGLDKVRRFELFRLLHEMNSDKPTKTLIMVDHDFDLIFTHFHNVCEIMSGYLIRHEINRV